MPSKAFRFALVAVLALCSTLSSWSYDLIYGGTQDTGTRRVTWDSGSIPFVIRMSQTANLQDGTSYASSVQAAMSTWNAQLTNVQFSSYATVPGLATDGDGLNEIAFDTKIYSNAANGGEDFGESTLAVTLSWTTTSPRADGTFRRTQSDILFNSAWTWNSYRGVLQQPEDIRRVAIHELGHVLGLDHPDQAGQTVTAIMNAYVSNIDTLQADDLTGAQFLYGSPNGYGSPANDNFASATTITLSGNSATLTASSVGASKEAGEPHHGHSNDGASIWWKWTAPANGTLTVNTLGTNFDTLLAAYTGGSVDSLSQLAANDDTSDTERRSTVTITVSNGTTYYFAVAGWDAQWGAVRLAVAFTPSASNPPQFSGHPANMTVNDGSSASFSAYLVNSTGVTYRWQRFPAGGGAWAELYDSAPFSGTSSSYLSISPTSMTMNGDQFRCVATNPSGSTASNAATLTVRASAPVIVTQPVSVDVVVGGSATFTVGAIGTAPLSYQWYRNGSLLSGATASSLTLTNLVDALNSDYYNVVVSNSVGSASSYSVRATIVAQGPTITEQPIPTVVVEGSTFHVTVAAYGGGTLRYQWYRDGVAIPNATTSYYSVSGAASSHTGDYYVSVANVVGTVTSATVHVQVVKQLPPSKPQIIGYGGGTLGGNLSLTLNTFSSSSSSPTYQWYRDGVAIPGATYSSYSVSSAGPADFGSYYLTVSNSAGTGVSNTLTPTYTPISRDVRPTLWSRSREFGGIVYFLFADTPRIARYDLANEAWLSTWALPAKAFDFAVTTEGVYVAYADKVARYSADFASSTDLFVAPAETRELLARPGQLLVVSRISYYDWSYIVIDRVNGQMLSAQPIPIHYGAKIGLSYSPQSGRIFGISSGISPSDIWRADWRADGVTDNIADSPYHGDFEPILRTFALRDGQRVVEQRGGVYSTVDLTPIGTLGGAFDDLLELEDGRLLLARAGSLVVLDGEFNLIGSGPFSAHVVAMVRKGNDVIGFAPPATAGGLPDTTKKGIASVADSPLAETRTPLDLSAWSSDLQFDDYGNLYVFSRRNRNVYQWSAYQGRYTATFPLRGGVNNWAVVAEQGAIYQDEGGLRLRRVDESGVSRTFYNAIRTVTGMHHAGKFLFTNSFGYSVFGSQGDILGETRSGENSRVFEWNEATRRMLHFRASSPDDLMYHPIGESGIIGNSVESPYHGEVLTDSPIRVSSDGQRIVLGSGQIFSGSGLTLLGSLPVKITDAAWTGAQTLHTIRSTYDGTELTTWSSNRTVVRSTTFSGAPIAVFAIPGDYLVMVTASNTGGLEFRTLSPADHQPVDLTNLTTAPVILRQPSSASASVGDRVALSAAACAGANPTYQWQRNGQPLANGAGVSGANSATLVLGAVGLDSAGAYTVAVTNANGSTTSATATLTVTVAAPRILQQPIGKAVGMGNSTMLFVKATDALPLTYQWQRDGAPLDGATAPTLSLTNFDVDDVGAYTVVVSNGTQSTTSSVAQLTLVSLPIIPTQPQNLTADVGINASLSIPLVQGTSYTYQWYKNGQLVVGGGSNTLFFSPLTLTDAGTYYVRVSNASGAINSATVTVTPVTRAPQITSQPADVVTLVGGTASFEIKVSAAPAATYQWQVLAPNTTIWANYASQASYLYLWGITSAQHGTRFRCVVTNEFGSVTSAEARLIVGTSTAVASITAGDAHSIAISTNGIALVTGSNSYGQLGVGTSGGWNTFTANLYQMAFAAAGESSSYFIGTSGWNYASGNNSHGQFGTGSSPSANNPPTNTFWSAISLAPGYRHTLALMPNGTLWGAGANDQGQLGDGTQTERWTAKQVATRVVAMAAGYTHSFYIRADGTLWAMGGNADGQFGDGSATGSLVPVPVGSDIAAVSTYHHAMFLRRDGTLWAAGRNDRGQLGNDSTTAVRTAVQIASDVVAVSVGAQHTVFLKTNGTVWAMGANDRGQLGDGSTTDRHVPVQVGEGALALAAGHFHTLMLKADGSVWAVGANESGQLGDGTKMDHASWVKVVNGGVAFFPTVSSAPSAETGTDRNYIQLSWGWSSSTTYFEVWRGPTADFSQATLLASRLTVPRFADYSSAANVDYYYWVLAVNAGGAKQLGSPVKARHDGVAPTAPSITTQPVSVTVGDGGTATFSVIATGTGTLNYRWRRNGVYLANANAATYVIDDATADKAGTYSVLVIDDAGQTLSSDAVLIVAPAVTTVASTAQSIDGLPRLYTVAVTSTGGWSTSSNADWVSVGPARGYGNSNAVVIADANLTTVERSAILMIGGVEHVVTQAPAPDASRKVWLAGLDGSGQLGQGRLLQRSEFGFALSGVKSIAVGERATYFIREDDSLWFTGVDYRNGPAGDPAQKQTDMPIRIAGSVARVAASGTHVLYLTTDGSLWACGNNGMGELGMGTGVYPQEPRLVTTGVKEIAAGNYVSLFIKTDGTVWGMGNKSPGGLGAGLPQGTQYTPIQVATSGAKVAMSEGHSALLKTDGTLWLTGSNGSGQLGVGDTNARRDWVQVANGVADVQCSSNNTVFRKTDGTLWGMGANGNLQLGAGAATITTPIKIADGIKAFTGMGTLNYYVTDAGELWVLGRESGQSTSGPRLIASDVAAVVANAGLKAILKTDRSVWTAGPNHSGQLGAHTSLSRSVPVQVGTDGRQVGVGEDYVLWNDSTGTVRGAGFGRYNQLNASLEAANSARTVATGVVSSSVGSRHSLHIKSDGSLVGFGSNSDGRLGLADNWNYLATTLQPAAIAAYAGDGFSFFLKPDHTLWAMGRNDSGQLGVGNTTSPQPATQALNNVVTVALGRYHAVALRGDSTLWTTGSNSSGQLGTGDTVNRASFTQITSGVRSVAAGEGFTVWVKLDGAAWIVGSAPVSVNGSTSGSVPRQFATDVVSVAAYGGSLFVLKNGGELWCAGRNDFGQLADGTFISQSELKPIGLGVLSLSVGEHNSGFIAPVDFITAPQPPVITIQPRAQSAVIGGVVDFTVSASGATPLAYQWQLNGVDIAGATASTLHLSGVGANDIGYYSVVISNASGATQSEFAGLEVALPPSIVTAPASLSAYSSLPVTFSVIATGGGLSYQWLRDGVAIAGATTSTYTIASVRNEDAGEYRVVVSNAAGTITTTAARLTVLPGAAPVITVQPQTQLTGLGGRVAFTVVATGSPAPTYRWQRLGLGWTQWQDLTETNSYSSYGWDGPTLIALSTAVDVNSGHRYRVIVSNPLGSVTSQEAVLNISGYAAPTTVAAGYTMTTVIRADGQSTSTGANNVGQYGDGTTNSIRNLLTPFGGPQALVSAHLGFEHSMFIKVGAELWVAGDNQLGQLGDGTTTTRSTPVRIPGAWAGAAGGYRHSLFRANDGQLFAVGWNSAGQLGDGTVVNRTLPVKVADHVVAVAAGFNHSLFVKGDGTAFGMGNNNGLFGDGSITGSLVPMQIATNVADVASFYHTVFLKRDGTVWTTGRNDRGQLGLGDVVNRTSATQVGTGVIEIAVGALHTVMLKSDGTVWTFGANDHGQLGDNSTTDRRTPVQVASNVATISAGLFTTAILKNDGSIWMTGANDVGQLGDNSTTDRASFVQVATGQPAVPSDAVIPAATVSDSADRIALSWTPSRGATYYRVWRHTTNDAAQATLLAARVKGTYFEDTTASAGVTYRYWVQPVNAFGQWPLLTSAAGRRGAALVGPSITTQPASQTVNAGTAATFMVEATGSAPLVYKWMKGSAEIPDASAATFTIPAANMADSGEYSVIVSNPVGSVTSAKVTLTVNKLAQTISFPAIADRTFAPSVMSLNATATSGLPVAYSLLSGPAQLVADQLTLTGAGTITIRASQSGDATYAAAPEVERSFVVHESVDSWARGHFSESELLDPAVSGPNADPDRDGIPNLIEYALGLDPRVPTEAALPPVSVTETDWSYTYSRPIDRSDLTYTVEYSVDLVNWSPVSGEHRRTSGGDGTETWTATQPRAAAPNCYFRLAVTRVAAGE